MMTFMPREPRLQPLLLDDLQRLAQRVDQVRAERVVILAVHPVVFEQLQIQVEAAARDQPLAGRAGDRDRGHARRCADALLRAGIRDIDAPPGQVHVVSAE
jgi:hypothetical protein